MPNKHDPVDLASLQSAKTSFDVRYYRWAQDAARTEVKEGLATLQTIKNPLVHRFLEIAQSMHKKQQSEFLNALVKRAHLSALEPTGDSLSARDEMLINKYLTHDTYLSHGTRIVDATFERSAKGKIRRPVEQRANLPEIDKKLLRSRVVEKLRPKLGSYSVRESQDGWWYDKRLGAWSVWTIITANKKHAHLSYCHRINSSEGVDLRFPLSAMQWFGLGGSTDWILWNDSEIDDATDSLSTLVMRFLDAAPSLLAGTPGAPPLTFTTRSAAPR